MIKYLLVVFPHGSYENSKSVMNALAVTGKYKRIISDRMPVYLKEGHKYQVFCIDHSRFKLPRVAVGNMVNSLSHKKVEVNSAIIDNPSVWLAKNGYEAEAADEKFL